MILKSIYTSCSPRDWNGSTVIDKFHILWDVTISGTLTFNVPGTLQTLIRAEEAFQTTGESPVALVDASPLTERLPRHVSQ